jgi:hypothetical protein
MRTFMLNVAERNPGASRRVAFVAHRLTAVGLLNAIAILSLFIASEAVFAASAGAEAANSEKRGREATPAVVHPAIRSALRPMMSLDGDWDFCADRKLEGESAGWFKPGMPLPERRTIHVPGCWEAQGVGEPGLSNANNKFIYEPVNVKLKHAYTGAGWYKKDFTVPADWAGRQVWLKIGGVNAQGWIWFNGVFLGHDWTYCGTWKYNVTDLVKPGQKATLAVLARNDVPGRRGESNSLRMYGGLSRSVELDATPDVSIDNVYPEHLLDQKKVRLHATIRNVAGTAPTESYTVDVKVTTASGGEPAGHASQRVVIAAGATANAAIEIALDPFMPWSPESPTLYKAEIVLKRDGKAIDGWVERFGVKKYEVRGGDYYLNNVRYFARIGGDDHAYPITVCSPTSREEHVQHLKLAKAYGFNCVRLHTHSEIPEYYEAADEVGILVQPELPYYGEFAKERPYSHLSGSPLSPEADLREIIAHYRRYTSLAIYCGGNEGNSPMPLAKELYRLAKSLDPSRPWLNMDGGQNNTRENSEVNHYGYGCNYAPLADNTWPHVKHEFLSLGINEDPRLESRFAGGYASNLALRDVQNVVKEQVGLDWKWAEACFDAGHRIQGIWQKIGIESARIDPNLDGFSLWLLVDLSPSTQCGVFDMFWGKKHSSPDFFRQFNAPTVILAKTANVKSPETLGFNPSTLIYREGDTLDVDWIVSHFQPTPVKNGTIAWRLVADGKTVAQGKVEKVDVAAGSVPVVGRSRITMPALTKAVKASLIVELDSAQARNSWNLWIFPKSRPQPEAGRGMAASAGMFNLLAPRYPGLAKLGESGSASAKLVVARSFMEPGVLESLREGKSVICLSLPGFNILRPGTSLAEWAVSSQAGTAIASHPAFGDFPNSGYLDQGWFRLVDTAEKLDSGHRFKHVEPLMVGIGRATGYSFGTLGYPLGFNLYAFQTRVGQGRLLSTGLNLASDNPEAVYLLDQFIAYARSTQFRPTGNLDLAAMEKAAKECRNLNGWRATVDATERTPWHSFVGEGPMCVVRQLKGGSRVAWTTGEKLTDSQGRAVFRWIANLGWQSQPGGGKFALFLGKNKLLDFDISMTSAEWKSPDAKAVLRYTVKETERNEDSTGIMELTIPASMAPSQDGTIELRVEGSGPESRRYFGLQER